MTSDRILERLFALHPKLIDLSLDRIERLLAALDHPERRLPPIIHVAGTNGKGSTVAFLRAVLEAHGKRVQAYTSPHLVRFHERIRLSDGLIGENRLAEILRRCEAANTGQPITYFEITTVAALLAFAEDDADFCLLEVGLGGRFDATNVIGGPVATVVTPVAFDHQEFLGNDLGKIAHEKAGILKPGAPAIVGPQEPDALSAIENYAREIGAPLHRHGREWHVRARADGWVYEDGQGSYTLPLPSLSGAHQTVNAGTALACLRQTGIPLSESRIAAGLQAATWPARLQPIPSGPIRDLLPPGTALVLDGGHNPHAAAVLAEAFKGQRIDLVFGMLKNKDAAGYLEALGPALASVHAIPIPGEACHAPEDLAKIAAALGIPATAHHALEDALAATTGPTVLIGGSLYLAGHVLERSGMMPV